MSHRIVGTLERARRTTQQAIIVSASASLYSPYRATKAIPIAIRTVDVTMDKEPRTSFAMCHGLLKGITLGGRV